MKTKEELNALKNEVEALNKKLAELNEDELKQVSGGYEIYFYNLKHSENDGEEKLGDNVGFFPGLSGFP